MAKPTDPANYPAFAGDVCALNAGFSCLGHGAKENLNTMPRIILLLFFFAETIALHADTLSSAAF